MNHIDTDEAKIDELLSRSVDSIYPSKEKLKELLLSGKQIRVYVGIDPTADYVHLGHSTNYLLLERLHKLGHKLIILVGDFTAMIGDPTDKSSARTQLTKEQVMKNLATFKEQIGKIIDFNNTENPVDFKFNSEWLAEINFEKVIELCSNFTVQQMLERDMFKVRMQESKPLYVHEFFYPLMQGYDSVALEVDLEIGGTDQTFNMLTGRILSARYLSKEKFVLTTTLLINPVTGEKLMSKSLGTGVAISDTPENMFGKIMSLPDEGVIQTFIDCTRLDLEDIDDKQERLKNGENPKNIKLELAQEIVRMYHGDAHSLHATEDWEKKFSKKEIPDDMPVFTVDKETLLVDELVTKQLVESKSQARRLISAGAIKILETETVIADPNFKITEPVSLRIGKKTFARFALN